MHFYQLSSHLPQHHSTKSTALSLGRVSEHSHEIPHKSVGIALGFVEGCLCCLSRFIIGRQHLRNDGFEWSSVSHVESGAVQTEAALLAKRRLTNRSEFLLLQK